LVEGAFPTLPTDAVDDLGNALVLADLLAEGTVPGPRPPRPPDGLDDVARLKASVRQLEHALASRVLVEQAIGVLSERWRVAPRDAFEQLRRVTRSHGLRIHDLAKLVIESSTNSEVALPAELVPAQRRAEAPPQPRRSPDGGRGRGDGERRRNRSRDGAAAPAAAPVPVPGTNGGRPRISKAAATPAPRAAHGGHARAER
jgi:hypothetical protein